MNLSLKRKISIRVYKDSDITSIVGYFLNASPSHLYNMGVHIKKMPDREHWIKMLQDELILPSEFRKFYFLIWILDGKAIGHSNLTNIKFQEEAYMHLHLWDKSKRNSGIGTELMKLTLKHYFHVFGIKKLYCEPYALNIAPHKVLKKVGFDFLKEYTTTPGWLSFEQPVKQWAMTIEKFELIQKLQPSLLGQLVKIVPLDISNYEELYKVAADPLIWVQHPNKNRYKKNVFKLFFKGALESQSAFIIYDVYSAEIIGSTRYYDINLNNSSIAIGYTFLARSHWGKGHNSEVKKLLLNYVFSFVNNVVFHIGVNNIRSQKAIEKLGAEKVGEQEMSYHGEDIQLNYVYQIKKHNWIQSQD